MVSILFPPSLETLLKETQNSWLDPIWWKKLNKVKGWDTSENTTVVHTHTPYVSTVWEGSPLVIPQSHFLRSYSCIHRDCFYCWLAVVYLPLWKMMDKSSVGIMKYSKYDGKVIQHSMVPVTSNQIYCWWHPYDIAIIIYITSIYITIFLLKWLWVKSLGTSIIGHWSALQ